MNLKVFNSQKDLMANCFNKAAATYDMYCNVQQLSGMALLEMVKSLNLNPNNIIDLGCGTGLVTQRIAEYFSCKTLYAIDHAEQLLIHARERLKSPFIKVCNADFDELGSLGKIFDLVFSNMALHWSFNLSKTISSVYHCLSSDGTLIFAIPLKGTFAELKDYSVNEFLSFKEIEGLLINSNLTLISSHFEVYQESFDSIFLALKSIKGVGANHVNNRQHNFALLSSYFKGLNSYQPFTLTYNIGFFAAQKQ